MAPEYSMGKAIDTVKADVYSFGVVLLEIVSGTISADKVSVSDRINSFIFYFFW